ncbi:hypothetical protein MJO28_006536 [Puccinia striiformis f. sp. tritici]|uniref:Uncharacterized protein n=2 Tax=Puccinia striiformis f. sp. tritici TaxID=168172 RepID=A0A0L0VVS1_9BASI|nr:hypothetical protein Pst134EB_012677 [Puccinia striiformis f. sp. tritici]KAI7953989.1 hypothetical protein MJO28_006536 [Puccinia striiformis f. sp. tritici]KNF03085.1 hypothetical protein PSTG_03671 [Puccinia striiformis f. sp. tritici PST-78]
MPSLTSSDDYDSESEDHSSTESEAPQTSANTKSRASRGKPKSPSETTIPVAVSSEQNNKTFFLPTMHEKTSIDHGCMLDAEGYPLLPNGNTTSLDHQLWKCGICQTDWHQVSLQRDLEAQANLLPWLTRV